jgi:penicillin-binding protein-related factor A (putative recombinase)
MSLVNKVVKQEQPSKEEKTEVANQVSGLLNQTKKKRGTGANAKSGNKFEFEIEQTCSLYQFKNLAFIQKFTPQTIFIPPKNGKAGFMMYKKKTGFDFVGGVVSTGQAIYFECKSTGEGVIPVWNDKTGIKEHQLNTLLWLEKFNKFQTFFLWKVRNFDCIFKFTPTQLINAIGDKKSLNIMDAEENHFTKLIKIRFNDIDYWDFLEILD